MGPSLTAAVRGRRTSVRAGTEEWLRRGPNQRMSRNSGQYAVSSDSLIPNAQHSTNRGKSSPTLSKSATLKAPHRAGSRFGRDGQRCGARTRTQSWGVALSDQGPGFLEVNFHADLNPGQLADGEGVLGHGYTEHFRECGFRF